jgi:hypothetical protein
MGDFTAPDCQPGAPGCVPHWYCYIPGAVTPDCLASLVTGTGALATAAGSTAGQIVGNAATGAVGGIFGGLFTPSASCDPADFWCQYGSWVLVVGAAAAAWILFAPKRGRR